MDKETRHLLPPMARPTIPLQWTKEDPDGKDRFEKACTRVGGAPVTVARALCDEFARTILAKDKTEFEAVVEKTVREASKKK